MTPSQFLKHFPNHLIVNPKENSKDGWSKVSRSLPKTQEVGRAVYFTPNGFEKLNREEESVTQFNSVYIDIDCPKIDGKNQSKEIIEDYIKKKTGEIFTTLEPSFIVRTKHGAHFHFLLKEPVIVTEESKRNYIHVMDNMVKFFNSDAGAKGINRVLRVPGYKHYKDVNDPYDVHLTYEDLTVKYELSDIAKTIGVEYPAPVKEELNAVIGTFTDDIEKRLEKMLKHDNVRQLYDGDISNYDDDYSRADSALCCHLAFWFEKDPTVMEQIWLRSPLGSRDKTQKRIDYRKQTIMKAIGITTEVYQPKNNKTETRKQYERIAYQKKLQEENWDDKEWVKELNQLKNTYALAFHHFLAEQHPYLLYEIGDDKSYWEYDEKEGIYKELSAVSARGLVLALLEKEDLLSRATESFTKDVLARYRANYPDRGKLYDDFDNNDSVFHANNGWVHLTTLEFTPHSPTFFSRIKSPVDYISGADCPNYDKFLDEDLRISQDKVRVIRQFSGLTLTNDIKYQKMLTLVGKPGCGKSTLLDSWGLVLGKKAIEKKLTELSGDSMRFAGSQFVGATLCWFDEVDVKKAEMGNSLGTLITGQHVNVERKGINGIVKARNTIKCVLTANSLPMIAELGIYRRLIMINLPRSFTAYEEDDKEMPIKLANEASGILNRMIEGLQDLRKMRGFTLIEGHDELIEQYKAQSNTLAEFLDTFFEPASEDYFIETNDLYSAYQHFAEGSTFTRVITPQKFGRLLAAQPLHRFDCIVAKRTKTSRGWTGLRLQTGYKFEDESKKIVPAFTQEVDF
jgi:putative DNA primase/helicase